MVYERLLRRGCAVVAWALTAFIGIETLLRLDSVIGVSSPEGTVNAVLLAVFDDRAYRAMIYLISVLLVIMYLRIPHSGRQRLPFYFAVSALEVKTAICMARDGVLLVLDVLGIKGGAYALGTVDGYLMKMIGPTVNVVADALDLLFAIAFICAVFATAGSLSVAQKAAETTESTESGGKQNTNDGGEEI